jgi:hypothetical protein
MCNCACNICIAIYVQERETAIGPVMVVLTAILHGEQSASGVKQQNLRVRLLGVS